jgi:hypothetical protein
MRQWSEGGWRFSSWQLEICLPVWRDRFKANSFVLGIIQHSCTIQWLGSLQTLMSLCCGRKVQTLRFRHRYVVMRRRVTARVCMQIIQLFQFQIRPSLLAERNRCLVRPCFFDVGPYKSLCCSTVCDGSSLVGERSDSVLGYTRDAFL